MVKISIILLLLFSLTISYVSSNKCSQNNNGSKPCPNPSLNEYLDQTQLEALDNNVYILQFFNYILTGSYNATPANLSGIDEFSIDDLLGLGYGVILQNFGDDLPKEEKIRLLEIINRLREKGTNDVKFKELKDYLTVNNAAKAVLFYLAINQNTYKERFNDYLLNEFLGNLTGKCKIHSALWFDEIVKAKTWAIQMFDSTAKIPTGIFGGNINWVGSFKQCSNIVRKSDSDYNDKIQGNYCRADIKLPLDQLGDLDSLPIPPDFGLNFGLCISDECDEEQVATLVSNSLKLFTVFKSASVKNVDCNEPNPQVSGSSIGYMVFLSVIVGWLLYCTIVDIGFQLLEVFSENKTENIEVETDEMIRAKMAISGENVLTKRAPVKKEAKKSKFFQFIINCSIYSNILKFFRTDNGGKITCLNGIRVISMIWIVFGHTYNYLGDRAYFFLLDNLVDLAELNEEAYAQLIINGMYGVDTFFLMSAFLVTTSLLNKLHKSKRLTLGEWIYYYVHRYWRLAPPFLIIIVIYIKIMPYLSSGPLWSIEKFPPNTDGCQKYWWSYVLFINNFVPDGKGASCMGYLWYIPNDYQFYCLTPIFVVMLYKFPKAGKALLISALSGTLLILGLLVANVYETRNKNIILVLFDIWEDVYIKPYCRAAPWIMGILLAYVFYKTKKVKLNWFIVLIGWVLSTTFALISIFGGFTNHAKDARRMETWEYSFYFSMSRLTWAFSISWIIFACHYGYGGVINSILSLKAFVPLTRLTYCAYLIHPTIMVFYNYSQQQLFHATGLTLVYIALGHILLTFFFSFWFTLLFEIPFIAIEKVIYSSH